MPRVRRARGLACLLAATAIAALAVPVAAQEAPSSASERELAIVELRLRDRAVLARDLFAWTQGGDILLPAQETFAVLGFPIAIREDGQASGWFLREKQRFDLDPAARTVTVAGRPYALGPDDIVLLDGVPHVSLGALNRWFSLGARFVSDRQVVLFEPPYLLADEEAARRSGTRRSGGGGDGFDTTGFATLAPRYRLLDWPHLTANFALTYDDAARRELGTSAQMLAVGDMAFMTGRLAISHASRGDTTARLTLGRRDADGSLLGPLAATYFELGDVTGNSLPLISRNGAGLGLRIGKEPITRADSFDSTDIIGDATPGWQAELFRDGELLAFQEIGTDGRFVFPGVPLRFDSNRFRVQLYGPAGEREVVDRTFDIADSLIEPGTIRYALAFHDAGRSLFGGRSLAEFSFDGAGDPIEDGIHAEASAGIGLSGALSLTGFAALRDNRADGLRGWTGASGAWRAGTALVSADLAVQDDGAVAWRGGVLTGIGAISLAVSREQYSRNFASEESRAGSGSGIASRTEATVDARLPGIGLALAFGEIRQLDGTRDRDAQLRISGRLAGMSATHRLAWRQLDRPGLARDNRIDGELSLSGAIGELRLRAAAQYDLQPRWQLRRIRAEANYRLQDWYFQAGFDRDFEERGNQWRLGANRDWNGIRVGLEGRHDDRRGDTRALLTVAFMLDRGPTGRLRFGRDARSDRGQIRVSGFHDLDADGIRSTGEPALDLRFVTDPRGRTSNAEGLIEDLPVDRMVALTPDLGSNPDPFLVPLKAGYRVMPRPGATQTIEVPLVDSADAELVLRDALGQPLAGIVVELQPCTGGTPAVSRTAHDGLAYFRQLLPGCYSITRPGDVDQTIELGAKDVFRREIVVQGTQP